MGSASVLALACALLALMRLIIHHDPLSKIPKAHWSVNILPGWILWMRFCRRENVEVRTAHEQNGPMIRLAPNEISINFVEGGIKTVYGSFEKHHWYRSFWNLGRPNMFSFEDFAVHSERRRALSRIYSKSHLFHSPALRLQAEAIIYGRLEGILSAHARKGAPIEMFSIMLACTMDIVTAFLFGFSHSSNFLQNEQQRQLRLKQYQARTPYVFYAQEMQAFWRFLERLGVSAIPGRVRDDAESFDQWVASMSEKSLREVKQNPSENEAVMDEGTVVQELRKSICAQTATEDNVAEQALEIASELTDHTIAGHETSGIALTYLIYELSRAPCLQKRLQEEVGPLFREVAPNKKVPNFAELDQLPLLQACVWEILRLYPPVAGAQARVTPKMGARIGDIHVPGGVRVSARALCLHQNASVYPEPYVFRPQRWLNADGSVKKVGEAPEMYHWWWAFGSGGRVCLGNHFAMHDIKIVAGFLYSFFETRFTGSEGLEQSDGFIGAPERGMLMIALKEAA